MTVYRLVAADTVDRDIFDLAARKRRVNERVMASGDPLDEAGAEAVKIEGARPDVVAAITAAEVPVMGHLGLTPQSLNRFGGFKIQGRGAAARPSTALRGPPSGPLLSVSSR